MSERPDLLQGIHLGDFIKQVCSQCKTQAEMQANLCPKCNLPLDKPVILPAFERAIEAALHHALNGRVEINARGELSDALKAWSGLSAYLTQAAAMDGLASTIACGFPRLLAECEDLSSLHRDIEPQLEVVRELLHEQLTISRRALTRLQDQRVPNPLHDLYSEYAQIYAEFVAELEKVEHAIGAGRATSLTEAAGKRLAATLTKIDNLVNAFDLQGPLWALQTARENHLSDALPPSRILAEWAALLNVVSNIANFPVKSNQTKRE